MTAAIKSGSRTFVQLHRSEAPTVTDYLPAGLYAIRLDPERGPFLEDVQRFNIPDKIYGDLEKKGERILRTFKDRPNSTGVLLSGLKGSGKSLLTKMLSEACIDANMPVIIIDQPMNGVLIDAVLGKIDHPICIIFDEFEKMYRAKEEEGGFTPQESLLTLLDGMSSRKRLVILTTNDSFRIDSHMKNRPGRILYRIKFDGLDENFIREYCGDNLANKDHIDSIVNIAQVVGKFNFDMLAATVEECNRYNESPQEAMEYLNISHDEYNEDWLYEMKHNKTGYVCRSPRVTIQGHPKISPEFRAWFHDEYYEWEEKCGMTEEWVDFTHDDLIHSTDDLCIFQNKTYTLKMTRKQHNYFRWNNFSFAERTLSKDEINAIDS